jgi:hypothetical protein
MFANRITPQYTVIKNIQICKGTDVPVPAMAVYRDRRGISLSTSALDGVSGQFHAFAAFPQGQKP